MPRLRREARPAAAGVPPEFDDIEHPAWASPAGLRRWFAETGVPEPSSPVVWSILEGSAGPATRRKYAIEAWLHANGYASEKWPALIDWHRVAEVPLPRGWRSDSIRERLRNLELD